MKTELNYGANKFLMFELDGMAYEYEKEGKDVIRLTLGKSELPLHDKINEAMERALHDFDRSTLVFPAGLPELREKLAKQYEVDYGIDLDPNRVIIGAGTSSLFRNIFQLLIETGDEVLIPRPYYSLYHFSALLAGAKIRFYDIDLETMSLNKESFARNFTDKTKIVVVNSPGNPLGNMMTEEEWYWMDEVVDGQAYFVSDEIYANACFEEGNVTAMKLVDAKSEFIVTNAFSKGFRMYAKRVGYAIVPEELVEPLTVIQHHTLLTLDPIVQFGAIEALEHRDEVQSLVAEYKKRCMYTINGFEGNKVRAIPSKGSFYITLDCENYMKVNGIATSLELAMDILEKVEVATVPGSDFGLPYTLRLSFSSLRYEEGIDRLKTYFGGGF